MKIIQVKMLMLIFHIKLLIFTLSILVMGSLVTAAESINKLFAISVNHTDAISAAITHATINAIIFIIYYRPFLPKETCIGELILSNSIE